VQRQGVFPTPAEPSGSHCSVNSNGDLTSRGDRGRPLDYLLPVSKVAARRVARGHPSDAR